jgi:phage tail sheath protein FI
MPQYLTPGVYVEEVPSAIQPIAGVSTSTAGFVGLVDDDVPMPLLPGRTGLKADGTKEPADFYVKAADDAAVLITSWDSYTRSFGLLVDPDTKAPTNSVLGNAVYGFFNNGGSRCWVASVADIGTGTGLQAALTGLAAIDEIAIVAVPGAVTAAAQNAVLDHVENADVSPRFAILDGQETTTLTKAGIQLSRDSSYGAIYYPWIDVGLTETDPTTEAVSTVYQPPSGHIAGVYARVDSERGVFKAPANEVIRGALGVSDVLSKADQAGLNPGGVNVIRLFGTNVTIWGARTTGGAEDPEWTYVSSRRTYLFIRGSIEQGTQWAVFEPNGPDLWSKIRRNVGAFLTTTWESGALLGDTAAQAFYVRCDETNNPEEVRDLGQLVIEIGVALVKPAEFVIFRISQWSGPAAS